MLTLDTLDSIALKPVPYGQKVVGMLVRANYRFPLTRTKIRVEGMDNLPRGGRVFIAMNHPDRYNYWPFQVELWKQRDEYTATWVKGKYYNNALMQRFMVATANIPAPSKGYVITLDVTQTLGTPPSDALYRVLRRALDEPLTLDEVHANARDADVAREFVQLCDTARDLLGYRFEPARESYIDALRHVFEAMTAKFVALNEQALDQGLRVIVMPEGTRSLKLSKGRPGLAQLALHTGATIVPVGCNNSDLAYPGNSPWSRGGEIVFRVGEPLTPEGDLAPYQINERYQPLTSDADRFAETFDAVTDLVMSRLAGLLDPRHLPDASGDTTATGARRFM